MRITIYATETGAAWSTRTLVWDSTADDTPSFYGGKLSLDIEKAGSLEFTVSPGNPYYSSFLKMKTILTVLCDDNTTLFRGRVSNIEIDTFKQKTITAEETLAYLNDSVYIPSGKDIQSTPRARLSAAISNHNSQMGNDSEKKFTIGTVSNSNGIDSTKTYNDNSYSDTAGYLSEELTDQYGGFFKVRYNSDYTVNYLDWVESYGNTSSQVIQFGRNIVELTREDISDDLFTVLIPNGDKNLTLSGSATYSVNVTKQDGTKQSIQVNQNGKYLEIPSGIALYGRIYKSENFSSESTSDLLSEAKYYISSNYRPTLLSFKVKVIDWHYLDETVPRIKLGDKATVVYDSAGSSEHLICTAIEYDLVEPEGTEFTFGVPDQTLSRKNDKVTKQSKKRSTKTAAALWDTNGKTKTLEADIVNIIGNEIVKIEGGHIVFKTDDLSVEDAIGNKLLETVDIADTAKGTADDALQKAIQIDNLIAGHLYVDDALAFCIESAHIENNGDLYTIRETVLQSIDLGGPTSQGGGYTGELTIKNGSGTTVIHAGYTEELGEVGLVVNGKTALNGAISIYNTKDSTQSLQDLLNHHHQITATELTGSNAGKVQFELGEVTYDSSKYIDTFNIASTRFYQSAMADAVRKQTVYDIQYNGHSAEWFSGTHQYGLTVSAKAMYDTGQRDQNDEPILAPMIGTNPDSFLIFPIDPTEAINYGKTLVGFASTVFTYNTIDPDAGLPDSRTVYANLSDGRKSSGLGLYMAQDGDYMYLRAGGNTESNNIARKSIPSVSFSPLTFSGSSYNVSSRTMTENLSNGLTNDVDIRITVDSSWRDSSTSAPYKYSYFDTKEPGGSYSQRLRIKVDASEPYSLGYTKGKQDAPSPSISKSDITVAYDSDHWAQESEPNADTRCFATGKTVNQLGVWYVFKIQYKGTVIKTYKFRTVG